MNESFSGARGRERTLAVTWGPWGGIWFTGDRRIVWRLCLGFVAFTYFPAEMTQVLDAWLKSEGH